MAELAHPERVNDADHSPKDMKQEVASILDGLDFSMAVDGSNDASQQVEESHEQGDKTTSNNEESTSSLPQVETVTDTTLTTAQDTHTNQKRALDDTNHHQDASEPKRFKSEADTDAGVPEEPSFENDLALLVQNALSNANGMSTPTEDINDADFDMGEQQDPAKEASLAPTVEPQAPPPAPSPPPPSISFVEEPDKFVRMANMNALGNLGLSLLLILCQEQAEEIIPKLRDFGTPHAPSFIQLRVSFEAIRGLVSTRPAISADALEIEDPNTRKIIDFANMARLAIWLVEGGRKSLTEADAHFFSLFNARTADLPEGMGDLYLEIKTQRALEAMSAKDPERKLEDVVKEFLTKDMESKLREQHDGSELDEADQGLISKCQSRQEELIAHPAGELAALRVKYPADELLRSFSTYVKSRLSTATELGRKLGIALPTSEEEAVEEPTAEAAAANDEMDLDDLSSFFEKTTSGLVQNALAGFTMDDENLGTGEGNSSNAAIGSVEDGDVQANGKGNFLTDYQALEALVAESTSKYVKNTLDGLTPVPYQPTVPQSTAESMAAASANHPPYVNFHPQQAQNPYYSYAAQPMQDQHLVPQDQQQQPLQQQQPQPGQPRGHLPPNQTFPSAILYDKARQAALSKTSAHTRREGLHSTRRPWTQEEEKALMAGLDMVKGPHWSQILTLFGVNGTISDILKDRTQVQLKDKARNLKLFFLKTNSEMPYYLQAVTGELKTRAPSQAARKEAEERARLTSEEDQAKLHGIMALAGGLQHHPVQAKAPGAGMAGAAGGKPIAQNVVTPAQAASAAAAQAASAGHRQVAPNTPRPVAPAPPQAGPPQPSNGQNQPMAAAAAAATQIQRSGTTLAQSHQPSHPVQRPPTQASVPAQAQSHGHPPTNPSSAQQPPLVNRQAATTAQSSLVHPKPATTVPPSQASATPTALPTAKIQAPASSTTPQPTPPPTSNGTAKPLVVPPTTNAPLATPSQPSQPIDNQQGTKQPAPSATPVPAATAAPAAAPPPQPSPATINDTAGDAVAQTKAQSPKLKREEDNSTEAALLKGLQAAVAEATS